MRDEIIELYEKPNDHPLDAEAEMLKFEKFTRLGRFAETVHREAFGAAGGNGYLI
jgi:hypothetical protein